MLKADVKVELKEGISDPEGKNILKALHLLGYPEVKNVRIARITEIYLDTKNKEDTQEKIEDMCQRLLTNPVIHDYSITISE